MPISDKVSLRINKEKPLHRDVVELRYFADYGHGFLGLFRALFEGRIEDVIRDPGPPYISDEDIPAIVKTLYSFIINTEYAVNIPKKYKKHIRNFEEIPVSKDSLF